MDIKDFRDDLLNRAATRASVDGIFTADAFMAESSRPSGRGGGGRSPGSALVLGDRSAKAVTRRERFRARRAGHVDLARRDAFRRVAPRCLLVTYTDAVTALKSLEQYLREA